MTTIFEQGSMTALEQQEADRWATNLLNIFQTSESESSGFMQQETYTSEEAKKYAHENAFCNQYQFMGVVTADIVDQHGGEGEGSDYYSVVRFTHERGWMLYIKFQGWYASHYGSEYESCWVVTPTEKVVVVYE